MTDVTEGRDPAGMELSAADEQLLRELTERARSGGLKLTGEGGLPSATGCSATRTGTHRSCQRL